MICVIDHILNRITMYRLMLYYTAGLLVVAFLLGLIGLVPQDPTALTFSCALIIGACWLTNRLFAGFLRVPTNTESFAITALILTLIMPPVSSP